jgi:membrane protease YdiL (CAAX protease family)
MASLFTPAHLHLAINHVPIIGLAVGCLPILIGILFKGRSALASGLLAVILCLLYERTGSLWATITMHATFNALTILALILWPEMAR